MAPEPRRKTETLSIRLDPKTKFVLEFVAKINGQSITTIVDRAIKLAAESAIVGTTEWRNDEEKKNWRHYWHPSDGVRTLKLIADEEYPTTFDEDELRSFTTEHWAFFYTDKSGLRPLSHYVDILWPKIQEFVALWRERRHENYWIASNAMKEAIRAAGVAPPEWPVSKNSPKSPPSFSQDLDDEIPF